MAHIHLNHGSIDWKFHSQSCIENRADFHWLHPIPFAHLPTSPLVMLPVQLKQTSQKFTGELMAEITVHHISWYYTKKNRVHRVNLRQYR